MGRIVTAAPVTPSRYLRGHWFVGNINTLGCADVSGNEAHLMSTSGGFGVIDDDGFGQAHWKATQCMISPIMTNDQALDPTQFEITKAGRSFVIHHNHTFVGGLSGNNYFISKTNDVAMSVSGCAFGCQTNNFLRAQYRHSGGLAAYTSAAALNADQKYALTWVLDAVTGTLTLWIDKAKDATLQNKAFVPVPDTTGNFTIGGLALNNASSAWNSGGTVTGKRESNLQLYMIDGALPANILDGTLIAWLIDHPNQHLSDAQGGA